MQLLMLMPLREKLKKKLSNLNEFWCELAMALGHTIGDLQNKISWAEYQMWMEYRIKYGPLNPVRMYDQAGAITAAQINNIYGGKASPMDFIFYGKDKQEEAQEGAGGLPLEAFIKALGGVKIGQRKRR